MSVNSPRLAVYFFLLGAAALALLLAGLLIGKVAVSASDVWQTIIGTDGASQTTRQIILQIRLPQTITTFAAGAGLALGGLLMQTLFANPVAGPDVLGISSGAALGAAIYLFAAGTGAAETLSQLGMAGAATLGAAALLALALLFTWRLNDPPTLLIVGLLFGAFASGVVSILQLWGGNAELRRFILWSFGDTGGLSLPESLIILSITGFAYLLSWLLRPHLDKLLLGEVQARLMGVPLRVTRLGIIAIAALLTGAVTAWCGPIGFIGVITPHIARISLRTWKHELLLPATLLWGGVLLSVCELLTQVPTGDRVLPLNAITALLGAPMVAWLVLGNRRVRM